MHAFNESNICANTHLSPSAENVRSFPKTKSTDRVRRWRQRRKEEQAAAHKLAGFNDAEDEKKLSRVKKSSRNYNSSTLRVRRWRQRRKEGASQQALARPSTSTCTNPKHDYWSTEDKQSKIWDNPICKSPCSYRNEDFKSDVLNLTERNILEETDSTEMIRLIKENDILYNYDNQFFNDNDKKEAVWEQIAQKLQRSAKECKKDWSALRFSFQRHIRKSETLLSNEKWKYDQEMSFIVPFLKDSSNLEAKSNELSDCDFEFHDEIIHNNIKMEPSSPLCINNFMSDEETHEIRDEIDDLFSSFAKTIKKFNPYYQAVAKAQVFAVISNIELQNLSNQMPIENKFKLSVEFCK